MSCLFDSLSFFLSSVSSFELRQMICDYIQSNKSLIENIPNSDLIAWSANISMDNYIASMRKPHIWGGAIEIKAFCDLFKKNVRIHSLPNNRTIECLGVDSVEWIDLQWTGGHYTPVQK